MNKEGFVFRRSLLHTRMQGKLQRPTQLYNYTTIQREKEWERDRARERESEKERKSISISMRQIPIIDYMYKKQFIFFRFPEKTLIPNICKLLSL
jgi:hypothetical protein